MDRPSTITSGRLVATGTDVLDNWVARMEGEEACHSIVKTAGDVPSMTTVPSSCASMVKPHALLIGVMRGVVSNVVLPVNCAADTYIPGIRMHLVLILVEAEGDTAFALQAPIVRSGADGDVPALLSEPVKGFT